MSNQLSVDEQLKRIITPSGKSYYQVQVQRARITALILAFSAVASLIFLVFSFVQKAAADTAREEAVRNSIMAMENEKQLRDELLRCRALNSQ